MKRQKSARRTYGRTHGTTPGPAPGPTPDRSPDPGPGPTQDVPFDSAEEAWFWAMSCLIAREDGARFVAGLALRQRPCTPDDLIVSAERLGAAGRLQPRHLQVLAGYGRRLLAPDGRARAERRAARLWDEALDLLATVWRRKGILA